MSRKKRTRPKGNRPKRLSKVRTTKVRKANPHITRSLLVKRHVEEIKKPFLKLIVSTTPTRQQKTHRTLQVGKSVYDPLRECKQRQRKANEARRRSFFRAKGKGDAMDRPIKQRRHKKCLMR